MKKKKFCHELHPQQQSSQHRHLTPENIITICIAGEIVKGCDLSPQECNFPCMSGSIRSVPRLSSIEQMELAGRNLYRVDELLDVAEKLSDLSNNSRLGKTVRTQLNDLFLLTFHLAKQVKSESFELFCNLCFDDQVNNRDNASDGDFNG